MNNEIRTVKYEPELIKAILDLIESGEIESIESARKKFLIGGRMTIQNWARKYGREHLLPLKGIRTLDLELQRLKDDDYDLFQKTLEVSGKDKDPNWENTNR